MKRAAIRALAALTAIASASLPEALNAEEAKVAIAGDSTVANYKPGDIIAGWGQEFKLFLKDDVAVDNQAMGGRSSKTFLSEGRWDKLLAGRPNFVLIQFGHNDAHAKSQPESTDAATDFKENLRKYADSAKAAGASPVFVTPMHRRTFANGEPTKELEPYASAIKEVAAEKGAFCVDLYEASGKLLKELGEKNAESLYCKPSDRSHFSPEGAWKMASLVAEGLKGPKSPMKALLRATPLPLPAAPAKKASGAAEAPQSPCACVHVLGTAAKLPMSFDGGSDGVNGGPAAWMKEDADQRLVVTTQPATQEWTKCHFSFTPKASGSATLILMSSSKEAFVCYDDVEASGATLENGGFETPGAKGLPAKWSPLGSPVYESGSEKAHSGKAYVKCASGDRLNASLSVEEGKQVSLSFWIRIE